MVLKSNGCYMLKTGQEKCFSCSSSGWAQRCEPAGVYSLLCPHGWRPLKTTRQTFLPCLIHSQIKPSLRCEENSNEQMALFGHDSAARLAHTIPYQEFFPSRAVKPKYPRGKRNGILTTSKKMFLLFPNGSWSHFMQYYRLRKRWNLRMQRQATGR